MKKLHIGIIAAVIVVALIAIVALMGSGGQTAVDNKTFVFDEGCTLDLPVNAVILNETSKDNGVNLKSYYITTNDDYFILEILTGNIVTSMDQFKFNAVASGATSEGTYGDWEVFNIENVKLPDGQEHVKYMLAKMDDTHIYQIEGDNLDNVKAVADTFKTE